MVKHQARHDEIEPLVAPFLAAANRRCPSAQACLPMRSEQDLCHPDPGLYRATSATPRHASLFDRGGARDRSAHGVTARARGLGPPLSFSAERQMSSPAHAMHNRDTSAATRAASDTSAHASATNGGNRRNHEEATDWCRHLHRDRFRRSCFRKRRHGGSQRPEHGQHAQRLEVSRLRPGFRSEEAGLLVCLHEGRLITR